MWEGNKGAIGSQLGFSHCRAGPLGNAKYDPLPGVLAAEAPTARDMVADITAGMKTHAAKWATAPSLSGLDGNITTSARG